MFVPLNWSLLLFYKRQPLNRNDLILPMGVPYSSQTSSFSWVWSPSSSASLLVAVGVWLVLGQQLCVCTYSIHLCEHWLDVSASRIMGYSVSVSLAGDTSEGQNPQATRRGGIVTCSRAFMTIYDVLHSILLNCVCLTVRRVRHSSTYSRCSSLFFWDFIKNFKGLPWISISFQAELFVFCSTVGMLLLISLTQLSCRNRRWQRS